MEILRLALIVSVSLIGIVKAGPIPMLPSSEPTDPEQPSHFIENIFGDVLEETSTSEDTTDDSNVDSSMSADSSSSVEEFPEYDYSALGIPDYMMDRMDQYDIRSIVGLCPSQDMCMMMDMELNRKCPLFEDREPTFFPSSVDGKMCKGCMKCVDSKGIDSLEETESEEGEVEESSSTMEEVSSVESDEMSTTKVVVSSSTTKAATTVQPSSSTSNATPSSSSGSSTTIKAVAAESASTNSPTSSDAPRASDASSTTNTPTTTSTADNGIDGSSSTEAGSSSTQSASSSASTHMAPSTTSKSGPTSSTDGASSTSADGSSSSSTSTQTPTPKTNDFSSTSTKPVTSKRKSKPDLKINIPKMPKLGRISFPSFPRSAVKYISHSLNLANFDLTKLKTDNEDHDIEPKVEFDPECPSIDCMAVEAAASLRCKKEDMVQDRMSVRMPKGMIQCEGCRKCKEDM